MTATRTAREVVELYNLVVWNERNIDLAEELLADSVIRHEVGQATHPDPRSGGPTGGRRVATWSTLCIST